MRAARACDSFDSARRARLAFKLKRQQYLRGAQGRELLKA
jgi:hypothetical protein